MFSVRTSHIYGVKSEWNTDKWST